VPPRRIVSLVPSITEILFTLGVGDAVAGCTIFCTQPPEGVATKVRVGGEKNPKLELIRELGADLVIANVEENLREHVETLRGWGIAVHVVYPRTVVEGIALVRELGEVVGASAHGATLADALAARHATMRARLEDRAPVRVFCPIWRKPYMTLSGDTYVHDMLATCGGLNVFKDAATRYPQVTLDEVAARAPEVLLLPDEPYRFRPAHAEDFAPYPALRSARVRFVDGKLLSWYGPRIGEALETLPGLLAEP
jgi:ABC-type Fe3+-hydroxamate transport system substrate-binding protein